MLRNDVVNIPRRGSYGVLAEKGAHARKNSVRILRRAIKSLVTRVPIKRSDRYHAVLEKKLPLPSLREEGDSAWRLLCVY